MGRERVCKTVAMCKSGLATINGSLAQARTVSCITHWCCGDAALAVVILVALINTVAMLVNSSELRAVDFHLVEVSPLQLDSVVRGGVSQ